MPPKRASSRIAALTQNDVEAGMSQTTQNDVEAGTSQTTQNDVDAGPSQMSTTDGSQTGKRKSTSTGEVAAKKTKVATKKTKTTVTEEDDTRSEVDSPQFQGDIQGMVSKAVLDLLPGVIANALPAAMASILPQLNHGAATAAQGAAGSVAESVAGNITGSDILEGENKSSINSVALPPDLHLSDDMKAKIEGYKFMKFGKLLYRDNSNEEKLTLKLDGKKSFVVDPNEHSVYIRYIEQWDKAFTVYSYRYLLAHPTEANDLLMYGRLIKDMAMRGFMWFQYDEQFRRLRENDQKSNPWGVINSTLWAIWATSKPISEQQGSNRGRGRGFNNGYGRGFNNGYRDQRSSNSFGYQGQAFNNPRGFGSSFRGRSFDNSNRAGQKRLEFTPGKRICFRFNKGRYCNVQDCRYAHKCNACGRPDHGEIHCRNNY